LAIVCALGYLELDQFGGLGTREALGGASTPLLLAAPGLLLLAGALLVLRVFPLLVEVGARLVARGRGATGMLTLARVARNSAGPSRLTLLLALAVGLGLFALTFDGSLVRSAADRASYQAGADLRVVERGPEPAAADVLLQARLVALPGVQGVTAVFRDPACISAGQASQPIDLLSVDPLSWARVAGATSWRADYASVPLASLMRSLRVHQWGSTAADRSGTTAAGDPSHPLWVIVSQSFASALALQVNDRFSLSLPTAQNASVFCQVGAVIQEFPTLYPAHATAGFVVLNLNDYLGAALRASSGVGAAPPPMGPNEYWLRAAADPASRVALSRALARSSHTLDLASTVDRQMLLAAIASNPVQAGMRGLLLVGTLVALAQAVLGSLVQSAVAARQRAVQFAVLRTVGMTGRQLATLLLGEQIVVYLFGLLGGTLLGLVLATATLPFLQFSDTQVDPSTLGVPPYVLTVVPASLVWLYAALLGAFLSALLLAARFAATVGLGKTLRLGED
jgi:hypothetical protein